MLYYDAYINQFTLTSTMVQEAETDMEAGGATWQAAMIAAKHACQDDTRCPTRSPCCREGSTASKAYSAQYIYAQERCLPNPGAPFFGV